MARTRPFVSRTRDFRNGIVGGIVVRNRPASEHRFVRLANNVIMRPAGAMSARSGSQSLCEAPLYDIPHSLGEWIPPNDAPRLYVAYKHYGLTTGAVRSVGTQSYGPQTWPYSPTDQWMTFCQLNNVLWATQREGSQKPVFMSESNADDVWLTAELPAPTSAPTLADGPAVDPGVEGLTEGVEYWYRVRWRYANGSSTASPVASKSASVSKSIEVTANLRPASPRSDYVGWTLERTKQGGDSSGPFYWAAEGDTTNKIDTEEDAGLFTLTDENLHQPPQHMDGLLVFKDRLLGWSGSHLYCSQSVDDFEDTGLCNWDPRNDYSFGADDGDPIQTCLRQQDRVLVFKQWSIWALEGDDPSTFKIVPIQDGIGASGPRAAAMAGRRGWFFSSGRTGQDTVGIHQIDGNNIKPTGWIEIGHYIDTIDGSYNDLVEITEYFNQYVFVSYPSTTPYNSEQLVYDQRFDNWTHFTGWRMTGTITPRSTLFGSSRLVWCDQRNWPSFTKAGVTVGMTVGTAGGKIDTGTTVAAISLDGSSITLNKAALVTQGPVTLTFGGSINIATCYLNETTTVLSRDYRLMQGFEGWKDDKDPDGSEGVNTPIMVETHSIDDGSMTTDKNYKRIAIDFDSMNIPLMVTLITSPDKHSQSHVASVTGTSTKWGSFVWGAAKWGSPVTGEWSRGLAEGIFGTAYKLILTASISGSMTIRTSEVDGDMLPQRRYS